METSFNLPFVSINTCQRRISEKKPPENPARLVKSLAEICDRYFSEGLLSKENNGWKRFLLQTVCVCVYSSAFSNFDLLSN